MARLLRLLPEVFPEFTALAQRFAKWPGDLGPNGASLPLRLASGLHCLVLTGQDDDLRAAWPPQEGPGLDRVVASALVRHDDFLDGWVLQAPQTNEVGRSAILIAAAMELATWSGGLPFVLSELGASAGLNLFFDRYGLQIGSTTAGAVNASLVLAPEWLGKVMPRINPVTIADRRGVDLNPLSPIADADKMLAYVWADQKNRLDRTRQALESAADQPSVMDQGDAAEWLEMRLATPQPGLCHLVFHTIAFQYFPQDTRNRITMAMQQAGARATMHTPLALLAMEADGNAPGAGVTLQLWPGNHHVVLGRAGFHGQFVDWRGMLE